MRRQQPPLSGGFGFPLGVVLGLVAAVLAAAAGQPVLSLVAMVAVVDTIATTSTLGATLATAAVCWCLHAGFVLGHDGELAFTPRSAADAVAITLCGLAAFAVASLVRSVRRPLHERESGPTIPAQRSPHGPSHHGIAV